MKVIKDIEELNYQRMNKNQLKIKIDCIDQLIKSEESLEDDDKLFGCIKNKYKITNDKNDCIKASELLEFINGNLLSSKKINYNTMATYLHKIGLNKKRLNNGIYYYGLLEKVRIKKDDIIKVDYELALDDLFKERNKQNIEIGKEIEEKREQTLFPNNKEIVEEINKEFNLIC